MTAQNELGRRIARMIEAQGPMSIAQFMTLALHDPQGGYYATRDPLGADFVTAPEISQTFGELVGLWCAQVWQDQGKPTPARLVELGPGRGTLMADALRAARLTPDFLAAIDVVLVESSRVLTTRQKEALEGCGVSTKWVSSISDIPHDRAQFTIANELFDALPIRQFVMTEKGWCERLVGTDSRGALEFVLAPTGWTFTVPPDRGEATPGAVYEFSESARALMEDVASGIAENGGAALIVDYGHAGIGFGGTLQAIRANRSCDILASPGETDISAHVDFGDLMRSATAAGAKAFGPIGQGEFLMALGILERKRSLEKSGKGDLGIRRLIDPTQMGTLFKVLALLPKSASPPPGFDA